MAKITDAEEKLENMLFYGGEALQEIYDSLPKAKVKLVNKDGSAVQENGADQYLDSYETAVYLLEEHLAPTLNTLFERHEFREIKQLEKESMTEFINRIRVQVNKCGYCNEDRDKEIILQIIQGCISKGLKERLLESERSLSDAIGIAKASEKAKQQAKEINSNNTGPVADIQRVAPLKRTWTQANQDQCYRCGRRGHKSYDKKCPALGKTCNSCNGKDHFAAMCQKKNKPNDKPIKTEPTEKKIRLVEPNPVQDSNNDWRMMFHVEAEQNVARIQVDIGGIKTLAIIDSGAGANMITLKTWHEIMGNKRAVWNTQVVKEGLFKCYGVPSNNIEVTLSFESYITVGSETTEARFYVSKYGQENLIGRETSIKLKILKLGTSVQNLVASVTDEFPKIPGVEVSINIDKRVRPIIAPYRNIPLALEEMVETKIDELLAKGIIEPVKGPPIWVSNIVPVRKANNDIRLCVDMRRANVAVLRENFPIGNIDILLSTIPESVMFSKLDLEAAYFHIPLKEDCRYITSFITKRGIFQFTRLMFGIRSAPEIFAKTLTTLLADLKGIVIYLDDILVYGKTKEEHDANLRALLDRLRELNLKVNHDKSVFNTECVDFLGHEISIHGIKPDHQKLEKILDFRRPESLTELRSFLGLVTYVNRFIPHLSAIAKRMRQLIQDNDIAQWCSDHDEDLNQIKRILMKGDYLSFFVPGRKTKLITDASVYGLGAVLIQVEENGTEHIIAFGSKSLTDIETRYSQVEKEALAVIWGMEKFEIFLFGIEFELWTDCRALEFIFAPTSKPNARIQRWVLRAQCFTYIVKHLKGTENIADPLSRLVKNHEEKDVSQEQWIRAIIEESRPKALKWQEILNETAKDPELQSVIEAIDTSDWDRIPLAFKVCKDELTVIDGIVIRQERIVVPRSLHER